MAGAAGGAGYRQSGCAISIEDQYLRQSVIPG
jgi:hypothetical protein